MSTHTHRVEAVRLDATRVRIENQQGLDVTLFANARVPVDRASLAEAGNLAAIAETIQDLNRARFFGDAEGALRRCVLTPDFHKGAGIPVGTVLDAHGFVLPRCAGTDIGCGIFRTLASRGESVFKALFKRKELLWLWKSWPVENVDKTPKALREHAFHRNILWMEAV